MNATQHTSHPYWFTKDQAVKVARDLIVTHHEGNGPDTQDEERLAVRIAHLLGIMPNTAAVNSALESLDELAAVERGYHNMIEQPGDQESAVAYFEGQLAEAIDDVVARFKDHMELAA